MVSYVLRHWNAVDIVPKMKQDALCWRVWIISKVYLKGVILLGKCKHYEMYLTAQQCKDSDATAHVQIKIVQHTLDQFILTHIHHLFTTLDVWQLGLKRFICVSATVHAGISLQYWLFESSTKLTADSTIHFAKVMDKTIMSVLILFDLPVCTI